MKFTTKRPNTLPELDEERVRKILEIIGPRDDEIQGRTSVKRDDGKRGGTVGLWAN